MQARAYVHGKPLPLSGVSNPGSIILEVELDDGRTVQMTVRDDGQVHVRGWGNLPAKVGNWDKTSFSAVIQPEEANTCTVCYGKLDDCNCGPVPAIGIVPAHWSCCNAQDKS